VARDLARRYTEDAVRTLVKCLSSPRERVPAAIALLDRGWGKPKEQVEQLNINIDAMGIDAPPVPETLEQWLQRRKTTLDKDLLDYTPPQGHG